MNTPPFLYFLPKTGAVTPKQNILVLETFSNGPPQMSEIGSIRQAVDQIGHLRKQTPWTDIIVDTDAPAGREILRRTKQFLQFHENGYDPHFHLSQLFRTLKNRLPETPTAAPPDCVDLIVSMLFSARSLGGRRPCMKTDPLIAEVGLRDDPLALADHERKEFLSHPLCTVPKFFIDESKRVLGGTNTASADQEVPELVQLAGRIATIQQSPFPDRPYNWLFTGVTPEGPLRSRVDDFIHSALCGATRKQCNIHLAQVELVRKIDRLMESINIRSSRLFAGAGNTDRYERIRGFLELIFGTWAQSLYRDTEVKPRLVNTALLNSETRWRFEQMIPLIERGQHDHHL